MAASNTLWFILVPIFAWLLIATVVCFLSYTVIRLAVRRAIVEGNDLIQQRQKGETSVTEPKR